jgi:hypothetical protein
VEAATVFIAFRFVGNRMRRYNIIFTRDSKVLLSSVKYQDWREIQDLYDNYMASLDFDTIEEVVEYLVIEYKLTSKKSVELVRPIGGLSEKTIELDF